MSNELTGQAARPVTGVLGTKLGMTQVWDENGKLVPVTVVRTGQNVVTQVRSIEADGYDAVQIAFGQIEGRPGAVGAVLKNGLRGNWTTSEMPTGVNPKTQDAVYRAVGKPGVVLIAEGPKERVARILGEEQRKVKRIVPNVPIHVLEIGPDSRLELRKLTKSMRRLKKTLSRAEVMAVANRLTSLGQASLPIPKGIDPRRVRPGRPR